MENAPIEPLVIDLTKSDGLCSVRKRAVHKKSHVIFEKNMNSLLGSSDFADYPEEMYDASLIEDADSSIANPSKATPDDSEAFYYYLTLLRYRVGPYIAQYKKLVGCPYAE